MSSSRENFWQDTVSESWAMVGKCWQQNAETSSSVAWVCGWVRARKWEGVGGVGAGLVLMLHH